MAAEPPAQTPKIDETLQKVADIIIKKPNVSKTAKEVFKDLNKKIEAKEEKEEKTKPELSVIKTQPEVASASRVITGPITGPIRPMAIMIENHRLARPQTGLNEANIVYEIPVEGGITRFMGIYNKIPGVVGPIRSCREYFVDRALEVSALYVHCGGSPKGYQYLASSHIFSIDEIKIGKVFQR